MHPSYRGTVFSELSEVVSHQGYAGEQYILRLSAPACASNALPGQFAHLQCADALPMRRPFSIMRANPQEGWVDFLYKVAGKGTHLLSRRKPGETISLLGPIGQPFVPDPHHGRPLLLGGGVGIPPMIFLAEHLKARGKFQPLVLMGSEIPFPFTVQPSKILVPGAPEGVIATMPLLEDWGIPARLASLKSFPGCHAAYVTDLARFWLESLYQDQRKEVMLFACGPLAMLEACARLAREYSLPCQVSLEEFMACAVGGCAGCVVRVETESGPAMKRVCVDGPVFSAEAVFPTA